jgi:hypothetical protein
MKHADVKLVSFLDEGKYQVSSEQDVASDNGFVLGNKTGGKTPLQLIGSEGRLWIFARR